MHAAALQMVEVTEQLLNIDGGAAADGKGKGAAAAKGSGRSSKPEGTWRTGDLCEARYTDGQWYRAKVTAVAPDRRSFTVVYTEYGNTAELDADQLRPLPDAGSKSKPGGKRSDTESGGEDAAAQREKKKLKTKQWQERVAAKDEEQKAKQNSWLAFATKKAKKVPGLSHKSIFASPEGHTGACCAWAHRLSGRSANMGPGVKKWSPRWAGVRRPRGRYQQRQGRHDVPREEAARVCGGRGAAGG